MPGAGDTSTPSGVLFAGAHPHDEFGIAATLRAHVRDGTEVSASWFARDDREDVERLRRAEGRAAADLIGIDEARLEFPALEAVALPLQLPQLVDALTATVERVHPELMYVPAFEGGHPDHDAVNFAASEVASATGVETREFPLYTSAPQRRLLHRVPAFARLLSAAGEPHLRWLEPDEVEFKRRLWTVYRTQRPLFDVLVRMSGDEHRYFATEQTRPLPLRDYTKPPHERPLLYERQTQSVYTFDDFAERIRRYHWGGGLPEEREPWESY